jgi:hypothetical protein
MDLLLHKNRCPDVTSATVTNIWSHSYHKANKALAASAPAVVSIVQNHIACRSRDHPENNRPVNRRVQQYPRTVYIFMSNRNSNRHEAET